MSKQTIDVSQLSGWSGLSEGTQAVTVKTIVNGVEDSASSNVVTVEKKLTKQTKEVSLLMVDGDQTILPDANMTMEKAIVKKPATLIPSNIRQGVSIGGVVGEMTGTGKEEVEVSEALDMSNGNQIIPPPDNTKTMSKVTIIKPNTFIAQNIKNGVEIGGITGTYAPEIQTQEKTVTITENGSFTVVPESGYYLTKVSGTVNVPTSTTKPQLNPVSISLNGSTLTITNPSTNGNFAKNFKVYKGSTLLTSTSSTSVDLSNLITEEGTYTITVRASGTNFTDSAASNSVSYTVTLPTLSTPTISLVSGTTIQIDTIDDNATTIEVFADGVSIGEVTKS